MSLLSPEARTALASGRVEAANLVELDFTFGTERYWTGVTPLAFEGEIWNPVGQLGKLSPLESSQDLRANGLELAINIPFQNGEPVPRFQNVKPNEYKGRRARVILAFFKDGFGEVIHTLERRYFMDVLEYRIDPKASAELSLKIESELMAGGKRSVKRWTDAQQRDDYPGDRAFQFLSYLASGVEVKWGQEGAFYR
ncbi:hypothetical protein [Roseibacillus ishigakijimensis]|uniref:Uncharacterized protein n=1 Tax=Roseibacillus ishigakijimensis TaxID=454146 RepID=A0A934RSA3_9BACT|nr:hypothetical protein [Roseibacillus ishigakijimensis]MBK1835002.1 hypothetical protein [Roseibacillus ishigakijimensis]